jgi:hypothetical protein
MWVSAASAVAAPRPEEPPAGQTVYELGRLDQLRDQPWQVVVLVAGVSAALAYAWGMIRRDTLELPAAVRGLLVVLRTGVLAALLLYYLEPQRRSVQQVVRPSRAVLLVDTSQSMGLTDDFLRGNAAPSRMDEVTRLLNHQPFLVGLRRRHDVVVYGFDRQLKQIASLTKSEADITAASADGRVADETTGASDSAQPGWIDSLRAIGGETQIGEALRRVLAEQQSAPLAGVVVLSDGGQNAGISTDAAAEWALQAGVPVFTLGLGSDRLPANVGIRDVTAPARAYPGDRFSVTAYIESQGLAGRTVTVNLSAGESPAAAQSERVVLGTDNEVVPVRFEVSADKPAHIAYRLRVEGPAEDRDPRDNSLAVDVEIVSRETQVLLWAGAASREYRFVRNLLWRDKGITVHVLLQTGSAGVSQEADRILTEFPGNPEEFFSYDCLLAFDANWSALEPGQMDLVRQWIGNEAGGLVFVAGSINTPMLPLSRSPAGELLPVRARGSLPLFEEPDHSSTTASRVVLSAEGRDAQFLWLEESALESEGVWQTFPGVFGGTDLFEAKTGATVYAHLGELAAGGRGETVYLAEHFYGAGRVFFLGSGEMWRLRSLNEAYFERFYTKLIRHVSQGRLLRGSSRGMLLVERDRYDVGSNVVVRAQLADAQHQPLDASSVNAQVTASSGDVESVVLAADAARPGMFVGQFTALHEGGYRIDLPVPGALEQQLTRHIQVRVPDREREHLRRNDALLGGLAARTGGVYYVGVDAALGSQQGAPLVAALPDRTETATVASRPDPAFEQRVSLGMLAVVTGLLCTEWLVRRLQKLA